MTSQPASTLLSLGSINADFQVRVDAPVGSRETLLAHTFSRFAGGEASNTAWLGPPSVIAACRSAGLATMIWRNRAWGRYARLASISVA